MIAIKVINQNNNFDWLPLSFGLDSARLHLQVYYCYLTCNSLILQLIYNIKFNFICIVVLYKKGDERYAAEQADEKHTDPIRIPLFVWVTEW